MADVMNRDEEINALLAKNAELQSKENAGDSIKADYLLLAKPLTKALQPSQKDLYIQGLQIGDIFVQQKEVILGKQLTVVPLAFLTLYQEKDSDSMNAKFFGTWNKEQATSFPLVEGSYFNRQLPNGHILTPVNWVMVNVLGHSELENAVVAFKSTGCRIWKKWKEDAKARSSSCATLMYTIKEELYQNDKNSWTDFGFEYAGNLLESDKKDEALECLKKSNAIRESYANANLIANHDMQALDSSAPKALESDRMAEAEALGF